MLPCVLLASVDLALQNIILYNDAIVDNKVMCQVIMSSDLLLIWIVV